MSPGNDTGRTRALIALATAAAATAVVMVLVTVAVATQQFASRQTDAARVTVPTSGSPSIGYRPSTSISPNVFKDGQIVRSDAASNAYFEVPPSRDGWTTSNNLEDWIGIPDVIVGPKPRARQPALYGQGDCEADPEGARAYVGLGVTPEVDSDDVKGWNEQLLESWRAALADEAKENHLGAPVVHRARELTLDDGTTAWMSSLRSPWQPAEDTCESSRVVVSLLSIDTGRNVATMTAFRNVGTEADLPRKRLQKILESIRPLPAG